MLPIDTIQLLVKIIITRANFLPSRKCFLRNRLLRLFPRTEIKVTSVTLIFRVDFAIQQ